MFPDIRNNATTNNPGGPSWISECWQTNVQKWLNVFNNSLFHWFCHLYIIWAWCRSCPLCAWHWYRQYVQIDQTFPIFYKTNLHKFLLLGASMSGMWRCWRLFNDVSCVHFFCCLITGGAAFWLGYSEQPCVPSSTHLRLITLIYAIANFKAEITDLHSRFS